MAGIGEASAILGVLQFGFSLAKTLTTYIGEYKAAADNITALANEIETTYRQVSELQDLLKDNQTTKGFKDSARINAETCCLKAEQLGEELWQMLRSSNVERPANGNLSKNDIQLSLFDHMIWPKFKPTIEEAEKKFLVLKVNIAIAMMSYHGQDNQSGIGQVRDQDKLDNLKKTKKLAVRELRAARKKRKQGAFRPPSRHAHFPPGKPSPPGRHYSRDSAIFERPDPYPPYHQSSSYRRYDGDNNSVTSSLYADIEGEVVRTQEQEAVERKQKQDEKTALQARAVAEFKNRLVTELSESERHAEETRSRLSKVFGLPSSAEQIDKYVSEQQTQGLKSNEAGMMFALLGKLGRPDHVEDNLETTPETQPSRGSRFLSMFTSSRKDGKKQTAASQTAGLPMFQPLDTPNQRSLVGIILTKDVDGHLATPVSVPQAWLNHALALEAKEVLKKGGVSRTVETFAAIRPNDLVGVPYILSKHPSCGEGQQKLLYATEIDETTSKTRRLLQTAALGREAWKLQQIRVLLVYSISGTSDEEDEGRDRPYSVGGSSKRSQSRASSELCIMREREKVDPVEEVRERRRSRKSDFYGDKNPYTFEALSSYGRRADVEELRERRYRPSRQTSRPQPHADFGPGLPPPRRRPSMFSEWDRPVYLTHRPQEAIPSEYADGIILDERSDPRVEWRVRDRGSYDRHNTADEPQELGLQPRAYRYPVHKGSSYEDYFRPGRHYMLQQPVRPEIAVGSLSGATRPLPINIYNERAPYARPIPPLAQPYPDYPEVDIIRHRVEPTLRRSRSRRGRNTRVGRSSLRLPTVEDYESGSSEHYLSDSSAGSSRGADDELKRLKAEAAARERKRLRTREGSRVVGTEASTTHFTESPTTMSDAEEGRGREASEGRQDRGEDDGEKGLEDVGEVWE